MKDEPACYRNYHGLIVHHSSIPCKTHSLHKLSTTNNKKEVTCKTCIVKLEFEITGVYPEKYYKRKVNDER